jgi:hypothetical protein
MPTTQPFESLDSWHPEYDALSQIELKDGRLKIVAGGGLSLWYRPMIQAPVEIAYTATVFPVGASGRCSDLNCFWMATDTRSPDDLFATKRSGAFGDYNLLRTYYASIGGNDNTTTRFRRYIGHAENRPLLPEHDLREKEFLLVPGEPNRIRIVSTLEGIRFERNGRVIFDVSDPEPYTTGHFAFRTLRSHIEVRDFSVRAI